MELEHPISVSGLMLFDDTELSNLLDNQVNQICADVDLLEQSSSRIAQQSDDVRASCDKLYKCLANLAYESAQLNIDIPDDRLLAYQL